MKLLRTISGLLLLVGMAIVGPLVGGSAATTPGPAVTSISPASGPTTGNMAQ